MKITLLKSCVIDGKQREPGDTIELSSIRARKLIELQIATQNIEKEIEPSEVKDDDN
jgi:hypothetical protein